MPKNFHILTITHKELSLDNLPNFAIQDSDEFPMLSQLANIKRKFELDELFYLSTCNRILCLLTTDKPIDKEMIRALFNRSDDLSQIMHYQGEVAVRHLFEVASSIHSLVVGEREILRQIRDAYEVQSSHKLTGDQIRIAIQHTIRTAKKVYAQTKIGDRPVSVVSLAVQKLLQSYDLKPTARFLVVGAGTTIQHLLKHLTKKGFSNFDIYNRSKERATKLVQGLNSKAGSLEDLSQHNQPFDCLIACTGSQTPLISMDLMQSLAGDHIAEKIWLDLGVPPDVDHQIQQTFPDQFVGVQSLKELAQQNLELRRQEVAHANEILDVAMDAFSELLYERRVERAFRLIPDEIKGVRHRAVKEVFRKDLEALDDDTRQLVHRMLEYMEKKCISIPMKAAKAAKKAVV